MNLNLCREESMKDLYYLFGLLIIFLLIIQVLRNERAVQRRIGTRKNYKKMLPPRKGPVFKVYYKDYLNDSLSFMGTIIERRNWERGNNLKTLLFKARKDYSGQVKDPSAIIIFSS